MNNKLNIFIKNISWALGSNVISIIISFIMILVFPKVISVIDYAYWQLYVFYVSYTGFLHLGLCDGVYLRYGGSEYNTLNKSIFTTQFWTLVIFELIVCLSGIGIFCLSNISGNKKIILIMTTICAFVSIPKIFLLYTLQATGRIKESSWLAITDRLIYIFIAIVFLVFNCRSYKTLICIDLFSRFIGLIFTMILCKDIIFGKYTSIKNGLFESWKNIRVGVNLLIANIASMLIIGVIRMGIEQNWDIETFGKISLTLSISNLLLIFINAIGIAIFPMLRRTDEKKLASIYEVIRNILMILLFAMLIIYYPLKVILSNWLPQYNEGLIYMAVLFPICIYEGKMSLLINTYFKSLRQEKTILFINIISLCISVICSIITINIFKNINLVVISIVFLLGFRCILAECILAKKIKVKVVKDIVLESILIIIFIVTAWNVKLIISTVIYFIAYLIYVVSKKNKIIDIFRLFKNF